MFQLKDPEWLNSYVSYLEYKKESKMEVAKRQKREKAHENGTKEYQWT